MNLHLESIFPAFFHIVSDEFWNCLSVVQDGNRAAAVIVDPIGRDTELAVDCCQHIVNVDRLVLRHFAVRVAAAKKLTRCQTASGDDD